MLKIGSDKLSMRSYIYPSGFWAAPSLFTYVILPVIALSQIPSMQIAQADEGGITTTVDRTQLTLGEQLHLEVSLLGSSASQSGEPQISAIPGVQIYQRGTSRQLQIINGRTTSKLSYNYILQPSSTGRFTIPPILARNGNSLIQSNPIVITVTASARPSASTHGGDLFVRATVTNKTPYVGEQVIYKFSLYRKVQITNATVEPPEMPNLRAEDLGEQQSEEKVINGERYIIHTFRKAIFAEHAGDITISPVVFNVEVVQQQQRRGFGFFTSNTTASKVVRSRSITLNVQARPPPPKGFSGLVGAFSIRSRLSKNRLSVGDSTTYTVTISGRGNTFMIGKPALPKLNNFKIYEDKAKIKTGQNANGLSGNKSYRLSLVPKKSGRVTIPAIPLVYFNPSSKTYKTSMSSAHTLDISAPTGKEELRLTESLSPLNGKVSIQVQGDDLLPNYRKLDALKSQHITQKDNWWIMLFFFTPPFIFLCVRMMRKKLDNVNTVFNNKRQKGAFVKARKKLKTLSVQQDITTDLASTQLSIILRQYIGDIALTEGAALTKVNILEIVKLWGGDDAILEQLENLLSQCDSVQYGGAVSFTVPDVVLKITAIISALENLVHQKGLI